MKFGGPVKERTNEERKMENYTESFMFMFMYVDTGAENIVGC